MCHRQTILMVQRGVKWKPSRAFKLAFASMTLVTLCCALESSCLSLALPAIAEDLHGTSVEAFWTGTSFLLASAVSQPVLTSLSMLLGRKLMIQASCILFAAGSIMGALPKTFTLLLVGRTVMGIGGGGIIALTETTITDLIPLRHRAAYFGYLSSSWAIGTVSGPFMGAVLTEKASWRWIFWSMVPFSAAGGVAITLCLNQTPVPGSFRSKMARFDWIGATVLTASTTSFLVGIVWGGIQYPWDDWRSWFPIIEGIQGIIGILVYEFFFAKEPMVPPGIFNNRTMIICFLLGIIHGAVLWCLIYYVVLYYQGVKLYGNISTALALLPETLTIVPSAAVAGAISSKMGIYRGIIWVGWALAIFGTVLLTLLDASTMVEGWIFLNLPIGVATGLLFTPMVVGIQAAGRPEDSGAAAAFFSFSRALGQSIGVALGGAILQNAFKAAAEDRELLAPQAQELSHNVEGLIVTLQAMPDGSQMKEELISAYRDSLRMVFYFMGALCLLAFVLGFGMKAYSLDQEFKSAQRLVEKKDAVREEGAV
ncbi:major facilitator superfamily transporter [Diaporthe sp. PMI_573]|nr:major facilitator superfamily transporter [Diaporthaceae sp. PMI_573]